LSYAALAAAITAGTLTLDQWLSWNDDSLSDQQQGKRKQIGILRQMGIPSDRFLSLEQGHKMS